MLLKNIIKIPVQKQCSCSQAVACGALPDNADESQLRESAELCSAGGDGSRGLSHPFSSLRAVACSSLAPLPQLLPSRD